MVMAPDISPNHPLRALFTSLVERAFRSCPGCGDERVAGYLANVLVRFSHRDRLFAIRNLRGRRLEQVAEMLLEGDVLLNARSFEREREVHKHIGDFTLFWTGLYPEMVRYLRGANRVDALVDYVERGQRSYRIASTFDTGRYQREAPILRTLSEQFEACVLSLHAVREQMNSLGQAGALGIPHLGPD